MIGTPIDVRRVVRRLRRRDGITVAFRLKIEGGEPGHDPIGLIPQSEVADAPGLPDRLSAILGNLVERADIHRVIIASAPGDMDRPGQP